jgi:hypothetical protein
MNQKQSIIDKTFTGDEIAAADLEQINRFTRRKLSADEVFCFSVILCDNEIDRDFERFPRASLDALAPMFVGKTGVFDHSAQAKNQSARIYRTEVITDGNRRAIPGKDEPYACLKAWAYMVRSAGNGDLILDIDAGIKKEVSVGCAVAKIACSVCGANQKHAGDAASGVSFCSHRKAEVYNGVKCCHELHEPTDAYEWSFVAVPAQKNAGVTKNYPGVAGDASVCPVRRAEVVTPYDSDAQAGGRTPPLQDEIRKAGEEYLSGLRREMLRLGAAAHPGLDRGILEEVGASMNTVQLKAFTEGFRSAAAQNLPAPQLAPAREITAAADSQFKI